MPTGRRGSGPQANTRARAPPDGRPGGETPGLSTGRAGRGPGAISSPHVFRRPVQPVPSRRASLHARPPLPVPQSGLGAANFRAADHLAYHLEEAPVWIFPVLLGAAKSANPRLGSSIYGAVQHLMLAARAHGIGSTLTTLHTGHEDDVRKLLNLPDDALTMALIPLGYPARGRWAQPKRRPLDEVVFHEKYEEREVSA
ncbi:nitroreductase family protein [Actinoplanes solisilvae]|uniref:nitroreductase family protein n=1 Tax=Actinoplanes solisilvae TaxID=2486853 RepID=UPI000FDABD43